MGGTQCCHSSTLTLLSIASTGHFLATPLPRIDERRSTKNNARIRRTKTLRGFADVLFNTCALVAAGFGGKGGCGMVVGVLGALG